MTMQSRFGDVTHPLFAIPWLLEGADRLFAALDGRLAGLSWNFWGTYEYCDETIIDKHSDVSFMWTSPEASPSQDDLDEIPAVRLIERRAREVAYLLPILVDEDGDGGARLNGEISFKMEPGRIEFSLVDDEDCFTVTALAVHENGAWRNEIVVNTEPQGCLTDIAGRDHQKVFEASVDVTTLGLTEVPIVVAAHPVDDGMMDFILREDAFASFREKEIDDDE